MHQSYWLLEEKEDFSSYQEEIRFALVPGITTDYYLRHPEIYREEQKWVLQLNRFLKEKSRDGHALLFQNSSQKNTWKQYGFLKLDEQMNLIFVVMLYLMEQSLKEENCTMDDIGAYIDSLNMRYLEKPMSCEDCRKLGDFILNVILSNEGRPMYFDGFDFEQKAYHNMNISYVANRIVLWIMRCAGLPII